MSKLRASTFCLRLFQRLVDPGMGDGLVLLEARAPQHGVHALGPEDAHQIVFEREEELRAPGSPCRPERPRSWLSMRRLSWRSVPIT